MSDRIFLLPGFGEDHRCFRALVPSLRSDFQLVHVDYRPVLDRLPLHEVSPSAMARELIRFYHITDRDRLIGHSIGGYFSYGISTVQGNPAAMLSSFSDTGKIVRFTENKLFNYSMVASGLIKTPVMEFSISQRTRNKTYLDEMLAIQKNFRSFSNTQMIKMLTLSYGEDLPPALAQPLRIHAPDDPVVRPPDEHHIQVPGGHFSLIFYPEAVFAAMECWLHDGAAVPARGMQPA